MRMPQSTMNLKVIIPFEVFVEKARVTRVVADTGAGYFGLLPHRLDCVAALVPGILSYETEHDGEVFLAVDEGVLVKCGYNVLISVRRALVGGGLEHLRDLVEKEFLSLDESELRVRSVTAKLEAGFMQRLAKFQNE